jgi:hypothetical protein
MLVSLNLSQPSPAVLDYNKLMMVGGNVTMNS